jgi:uncharacterized membrane protein
LDLLIIIGAILILAGLAGLGYCIWKGFRIRRGALPADQARPLLQQLVAVNLGSVALATFGLILLFVGLSF